MGSVVVGSPLLRYQEAVVPSRWNHPSARRSSTPRAPGCDEYRHIGGLRLSPGARSQMARNAEASPAWSVRPSAIARLQADCRQRRWHRRHHCRRKLAGSRAPFPAGSGEAGMLVPSGDAWRRCPVLPWKEGHSATTMAILDSFCRSVLPGTAVEFPRSPSRSSPVIITSAIRRNFRARRVGSGGAAAARG